MTTEKTELEKALDYLNGLNFMERHEIMQKVEYSKSITILYRRCVDYILKNKLYAK